MHPTIDHPDALNMTGPSTMIRFGGTAASVLDPLGGMIGEMALARMSNGSGTSIHAYSSTYHHAGSSSPRLRRHMMQGRVPGQNMLLPLLLHVFVLTSIPMSSPLANTIIYFIL
ncbi:hypothetical protein SAY87_013421 [Trapa incisa]|uniref:Uncharacterized protein n=1 Tax=Trapa incisa TaxID=236973 RepID=A0AAN7QD93_9MYRT|nr:hypothetical protein SAY87_013421 [Trapa incisa]